MNEGDEHMTDWPKTRDGYWTLHWHIPRKRTENRLSVVVMKINDRPPRTNILVRAGGEAVAHYKDARVGEIVEIAEKRWEIAEIDTGKMDVDWQEPEFEAGKVRLKLLGPAEPGGANGTGVER